MNDLTYFQKFTPAPVTKKTTNLEVWEYTRVSSKDQFENNSSLTRQNEANQKFIADKNFIISRSFGGTYESAKDDFTRAEFSKLISEIRKARKKPHGLVVFKVSRFSRSGGHAIGLVNELVQDLGIELYESSTGLSTTTPRGRMAIYERLLESSKENLEKTEIIIPAMQAYLRGGNLTGKCSVGYDHYGPKVRREKFLARQQRIVINKDGELLKDAWKMKASGLYSDSQILAKLKARGLTLRPQKISKIWRNPFYAGILVNKMIEEAVQGNWPALVSKEDFIKVQQVLEGNHSGFQQDIEVGPRPLTRLLKCDKCKQYMVGYEVKRKGLHYYKCPKCCGVSVNAITTKQAKRIGANDLFVEFLKRYSLSGRLIPLVKMQLTKLFNTHNEVSLKNDASLKSQYAVIEAKMKNLKIRHGLGEIDKETYDLTFEHLSDQMQCITRELNNVAPHVSNLEKLIFRALDKLRNIGGIWASSNLENKRRIQKTLFPDGIYYNAGKHEYRTVKTNEFIHLVDCISCSWGEKEKGNLQANAEDSLFVPRTGIEPVIPP